LTKTIVLICAVLLTAGCAAMFKYSPPTAISGNENEIKVRAGIKAGHPGGVASDHCRHYGKDAILSTDPLIDGYWPNTKIYRYECR